MRGDLTTLERYKAWAAVSGNNSDSAIERLISSSSSFITSWLNKAIHLKSYTEKRNGNGSSTMVLKNWPVKEVSSVSINGQAIPESNGTTPGFVHDTYNIYLIGGAYSFSRGIQNVEISYAAGFYLQDPVTIPATEPYQITEANLSGVWVEDFSVINSSGLVLTKVSSTPSNANEYTVSNKGVYLFHSSAANSIVNILYGNVPFDVEQACIELVLSRMKEKDRIGISSKSVANESVSYSQKDMTNFVKTSLQNYRAVIPL